MLSFLSSRYRKEAMINQGLHYAFGSLTAQLHTFVDSAQDWLSMKMDINKKEALSESFVQIKNHVSIENCHVLRHT